MGFSEERELPLGSFWLPPCFSALYDEFRYDTLRCTMLLYMSLLFCVNIEFVM